MAMRELNRKINAIKAQIKGRDGFLANPHLNPKHNARVILGNMPIIGDNPITNLKYHNLCTEEGTATSKTVIWPRPLLLLARPTPQKPKCG